MERRAGEAVWREINFGSAHAFRTPLSIINMSLRGLERLREQGELPSSVDSFLHDLRYGHKDANSFAFLSDFLLKQHKEDQREGAVKLRIRRPFGTERESELIFVSKTMLEELKRDLLRFASIPGAVGGGDTIEASVEAVRNRPEGIELQWFEDAAGRAGLVGEYGSFVNSQHAFRALMWELLWNSFKHNYPGDPCVLIIAKLEGGGARPHALRITVKNRQKDPNAAQTAPKPGQRDKGGMLLCERVAQALGGRWLRPRTYPDIDREAWWHEVGICFEVVEILR